jgi:hypothetical protein
VYSRHPLESDDDPGRKTKRSHSPASPDRRSFLGKVGGVAAASIAAGAMGLEPRAGGSVANAQGLTPEAEVGPIGGKKRAKKAFNVRVDAAQFERDFPIASHPANGDEELYPNKIGTYSKGLPHNNLGEVDLAAYGSLITALTTGKSADFENIALGLGTKLTNPQSGLAFDLMGPDSHGLTVAPAPAFASAQEAAEIAENYWMALTRDVPFNQYDSDQQTVLAASELSAFSDFRGPKSGGLVTPATLFRGATPGDLTGPYISQFMLLDTLFGAEEVDRQMRTVLPGVDYMTSYDDWLAIQNGAAAGDPVFDGTQRYIRNGRDLSQWVHVDVLFQAYFDALLILFDIGAPIDSANPYASSRTQVGFGTLGNPYVAATMCAAATRALKAVWYQKWFVHRRLRPEEFAGRIHNHITGAAAYPINPEILSSTVIGSVFAKNGTYLLAQAFPEGCPTHPAYGAGHATVAGACVTVLKAFFDESFIIPEPVVAGDDGLSLIEYNGPDLTVGGELNKLASNIAIGRNIAGVHWRTDASESLKLGEDVAVRLLREDKSCFNEAFAGFSLTKFDGTTITV